MIVGNSKSVTWIEIKEGMKRLDGKMAYSGWIWKEKEIMSLCV